jgi:hypothetical protein
LLVGLRMSKRQNSIGSLQWRPHLAKDDRDRLPRCRPRRSGYSTRTRPVHHGHHVLPRTSCRLGNLSNFIKELEKTLYMKVVDNLILINNFCILNFV